MKYLYEVFLEAEQEALALCVEGESGRVLTVICPYRNRVFAQRFLDGKMLATSAAADDRETLFDTILEPLGWDDFFSDLEIGSAE